MRRSLITAIIVGGLALSMGFASTAEGGVKIKGPPDTESWIAFTSRLQTYFTSASNDVVVGDDTEFQLRRARLQFFSHITKGVDFFMQTDSGSTATAGGPAGGAGSDVRLQSAWFWLRPRPYLQLIAGQHIMGFGGRNGFINSGTMLTFDLKGVTFKGLNLGTRGRNGVTSIDLPNTDAGLRVDTVPRTRGFTYYGTHSFTDNFHGKIYLGIDEGAKSAEALDGFPRYTVRWQFNLGDHEHNLVPKGTYLGKKTTIGLGGNYEFQDDVAVDSVTGTPVDYEFWSIDLFVEKPNFGPGLLNAEFAWFNLDLGERPNKLGTGVGASFGAADATGRQAEGNGGYATLGYLLTGAPGLWKNLQPWAGAEFWDSEDPNDIGSWQTYKAGFNYYILRPYDLVFKFGWEHNDLEFNVNGEGSVDIFSVGFATDF